MSHIKEAAPVLGLPAMRAAFHRHAAPPLAIQSQFTPTTTCGPPATQTKRHFRVILNQFNHPTGRLPAGSALFFRLRPARDTPPGNAM
jgi:hypothetical protein